MPDINRTQRTYHSPLRAEAAQRTRETVVQAAVQVFAERGYAGATIEQIAMRARVSRPTVFSVGNKAQLFSLARQHAATDGVLLTDNLKHIQEMIATISDPHRLLEQFATFTATIMRRMGPMQVVLEQAAGTDGELADMLESTQQRLLEVAGGIVAALAARGALRRGVSRDAATDLLWLQIQHANYRRLVDERGWSHRDFERWHAAAMITALLDPPVSKPR